MKLFILKITFIILPLFCLANKAEKKKKIILYYITLNETKTKKFHKNKMPVAFNYLDSIIYYSNKINDKNNLSKAYLEKGILLFQSYKDVSYYLDSANYYFKKNKNIEYEIKSNQYRIDILTSMGKTKEAEDLCLNQISLIKKYKLYDYLSTFNSKLSFILSSKGKVNEAIENENENLAFAKKRNDINDIARSNITLSKLYMFYDCNKATLYYNEAHKYLSNKNLSISMRSQVFVLEGQLFSTCRKKNDSSIVSFNKALIELKNSSRINDILSVKYHIAQAYALNGNNLKAREIFNELLELQKYNSDSIGKSKIYQRIATCYQNEKNYTLAIKYTENALALLKGSNLNLSYHLYYEHLYQHNKRLKNLEKTIYYLEKRDSIAKLLYNIDILNKMKKLEVKYNLKETEVKIDFLNQKDILNQAKIKRETQIKYLISLLFIVILIGGYLSYRAYKRKQLLIFEKTTALHENERIKAEKEIMELEQKMLLLQMNPHFIFNSLNSIKSFIMQNKSENAMEYLEDFAQLMRLILSASRKETIKLDNELKLISYYLKLEQVRMNFTFDFKFNLSEEVKENQELISIPTMFIQPFIENAIHHGLNHLNEKGIIELTIDEENENGILQIIITDNGIGRGKASLLNASKSKNHESLAIKIMADRIKAFQYKFNKMITFEIADLYYDKENTGTKVILNIPFISNHEQQNKSNYS